MFGSSCGARSTTQASTPDAKAAATTKGPQTAATSASAELPIPDDLRALVERSSLIGRQLYLLDQVAALGTDVLYSRVKDPSAKGVAGYLPLREGDEAGNPTKTFRVSFFTDESPPRIVYEVRVAPDASPEFRELEPPKLAKAPFAELVRARKLAIAAMPESNQPMNPVILPAEALGETGFLVYLLAGTKTPNVAVLGRHFRALVREGASAVREFTPLTNTALELPLRADSGEKVESLVVTHVVTDYPLETHVFTSLLVEMPIHVGTRRGVWRVTGEKIAYMGQPKGLE